MKSIYSPIGIMVALAAPLTVLSQNHAGGHQLEERQDWNTIDWSKISYTNIGAAPTPVVVANKLAVAPPASPPASTASASSTPPVVDAPAPSSSPPSSGGSSTTSTTCSGSGMNIAWTSDSESVPWSWDGGRGTTTPGSCTNLGAFSGQLAVNGSGGTIFEGNYHGGDMFYDVSFIIGYSAPMMCSTPDSMSGCSIDLHDAAAKGGWECPVKGTGDQSHICTNPVGSNGKKTPGDYKGDMNAYPWCLACSAPHAFFQPCSGSGYTYPLDDRATRHASDTIQCCIGVKCGQTGREGKTRYGNPEQGPGVTTPCMPCNDRSTKRGLDAVFDRYEKDARDLTPLVPRRKRSSHKHAHAHGAKGAQ